jgi:hypothetical protein
MRAIANQAQALAPALPSKIDRRLALRLRRQQLLHRDPPLQYSVVIDQSVLMRRVGDNSVMREQLAHLLDAAALPNVSLRVMRFGDTIPMILNSFDILTFGAVDAASMPDVVWTEHLTTALYFEGETDTFQYHLLFRTLVDSSLDPQQSVDLIDQIMRQVWS